MWLRHFRCASRGAPDTCLTRQRLLLFFLALTIASTAAAQRRPPNGPTGLRPFTTRHFVIRTNAHEAYATALGRKLDSYYSQLSVQLPALLQDSIDPFRISIIVWERQEEYQREARRNAPQLVNNGGYYDGATRTIVTYRYNNSLQLYFHEILHAIMGEVFKDHHFFRYSKPNWPIWFDEGLAEYFGSFEVEGDDIRIAARNKTKVAYLVNALNTKSLNHLTSLLTAPSENYSGTSMNLYYAQAWGLLDFLVKTTPYDVAFPKFYRAIRNDVDGLTAFRQAFGDDLNRIDAEWRSYLWGLAAIPSGWRELFNGLSIDEWTVHEGGSWTVEDRAIVGRGDENYNYLIKSELPYGAFTLRVDVQIERGTTGLILGNNYHGEYPYYYLIDLSRDQVTLRRAKSATHISTVEEAQPHLPQDEWVTVAVTVSGRRLVVKVNDQMVFDEPETRDRRYSLFGVYLYQGSARFRNLSVRSELPTPPAAPR